MKADGHGNHKAVSDRCLRRSPVGRCLVMSIWLVQGIDACSTMGFSAIVCVLTTMMLRLVERLAWLHRSLQKKKSEREYLLANFPMLELREEWLEH